MSRKTTSPDTINTTATTPPPNPLQALSLLCARYETAATRRNAAGAKMERELAGVYAKYQDQLAVDEIAVNELAKEITALAKKNKSLFPDGNRTRQFGQIEIGFRVSPPSVQLARGKDENEVAIEIRDSLGEEYVRMTTHIARDAILAKRDDETVAKSLAALGVTIVQKSAFFISGPQTKKPGE